MKPTERDLIIARMQYDNARYLTEHDQSLRAVSARTQAFLDMLDIELKMEEQKK